MAWTPQLAEFRAAQQRLQGQVTHTPLLQWPYLQKRLGFTAPVFLKLENMQRTGSFKVRGATNKLLSLIEAGQRPAHVVAASAGNHAQGVAFTAGRLGVPATIVMPEGSPLVKIKATEDYGARVILHGNVYDEAYAKAQEILKATTGAIYVHAYADEAVICGQGTLGLEIDTQLREAGVTDGPLQAVIPIGGGGLFSGVAGALQGLRPAASCYGVVCDAAPAMAESFKAGKVVPTQARPGRTLAEGLAVKSVNEMTFALVKKYAKDICVVDDNEIAYAISTLMERAKQVSEGAGAAGIAALLAKKIKLNPAQPLVVVICGGNIDMNLLSNILERGFTRDGRWLTLRAEVEDRPGQLAALAARIAESRGNILEVQHDRISSRCAPGRTYIRFQLETRGQDHAKDIRKALESLVYSIEVIDQ